MTPEAEYLCRRIDQRAADQAAVAWLERLYGEQQVVRVLWVRQMICLNRRVTGNLLRSE